MKKNKNTIVGSRPLVWLKRLEKSNESLSGRPATLWGDISMRAKLRGQESSNSKSWPGFVYLPSYLLERSIASRVVQVPPEWDSFAVEDLSRIVCTIAAWNLERHVYKFTEMGAKIVANSTVLVGLRPHPFAMLPGFSAYIDLENVRSLGDKLPSGFYVSINADPDGEAELVLVLDFNHRIEVQKIALDGAEPDELIAKFVGDWREYSKKIPQARLSASPGDLHVLLSAVLMTCINQSEMAFLGNYHENELAAARPVCIYEVGEHVVNNLYAQEQVELGLKPTDLIVVGEWMSTDGKRSIELKCTFTQNRSASAYGRIKGAPD